MYQKLFIAIAAALCVAAPVSAQNLQQSVKQSYQTQKASEQTQKRIDALSDAQQKLLQEYQRFLLKAEYQKAYNQQLTQTLARQEAEINDAQRQLQSLAALRQQLLPLLQEMASTLKNFIELDLPFAQQARFQSAEDLQQALNSSQLTLAEKFRRVMELYQAESDYSYDIGVYDSQVKIADKNLQVKLLRIGRSQLYYQSLDGKKSGLWQKDKKQWQALDAKFNRDIKKAIRIGAKQQPADLLKLPVALNLETVEQGGQ